MKWITGSIALAVIGGCVALALLAVAGREHLSSWLASAQAAGRPKTTAAEPADPAAAVATMHAENRAELEQAVTAIRDEFGVEVPPDRFTSHHAARDYLDRLRLARTAQKLGLDLDPDDFGDDEFMRRHIETVTGVSLASPSAGPAGQPPMAASPPAAGANSDDRPYVFINGKRYYHDGRGAYVRDDGAVLQITRAAGARAEPRQTAPAASPLGQDPAELMPGLDELLDMIAPQPEQR